MVIPRPRIALLLLATIASGCVGSPVQERVIVVHGPDGQTASVEYDDSSTVLDLKRSISKQLFVPIVNQRLFTNESELSDDADQLYHHKLWRFPAISVAERIKGFEIRLKIYSPRSIIQLQAHGSMTVSQLKTKIYFLMGIYPTLVEHHTQSQLINLDDSQRIAQLDIETDWAELHISSQPIEFLNLRVKTSQGWGFFVGARPRFTVRNLKVAIENKLDIPIQDQKLFLAETELNEGDETLANQQIWLHDSIKFDIGQIRPKRQLWLTEQGSSKMSNNSIEAYVDETIQSIRLKVSQLLQIPRSQLELGNPIKQYETIALAEGERLSDYLEPSVQPAIIKVTSSNNHNMVNVAIDSVGMQRLWWHLRNSDSIFTIKQSILAERNIDENLYRIRLFLHDLELRDSETFLDYQTGGHVVVRYELESRNNDLALKSDTTL